MSDAGNDKKLLKEMQYAHSERELAIGATRLLIGFLGGLAILLTYCHVDSRSEHVPDCIAVVFEQAKGCGGEECLKTKIAAMDKCREVLD